MDAQGIFYFFDLDQNLNVIILFLFILHILGNSFIKNIK